MRRRTLLKGTLSATAAPVLAGCGELSPGDDNPRTLVVHNMLTAGSANAEVYDHLQRAFERNNPGVRIKNLVSGGTDLINVYETARLADKEADVVMVNLAEKTLSWTGLGATVPVNRYLDAWGLRDRLLPQALKEWTDARGRVAGFPWNGFTWPVAYNTDLLKRYGVSQVPSTTDELTAAARKVRAGGGKGLVSIGGNDWSGQKLLMQIMQAYLPPERAAHLFAHAGYAADPLALRGLELFTRLRDAGVFFQGAQGLNADSMNTDYYTGRAPAISAISSTLINVPEKIAAVTELGGWPTPPGGVYDKPTAFRGYTATGIWLSPRGLKKLDLVKRFVTYLYRPANSRAFVRDAGQVMAVRGATESPRFPLVSESVRLPESRIAYAVMPDLHVPPAVSQLLIRASSLAYVPGRGAHSIATALDAAYRG
ncbi:MULTISPECIES: ABC transporter substrate-binding protein [unclassified Streptomyces]|uniref:ABC transporter substrate-binding protein n=1 Tax=unclassified Streptomyces TaxID=2593676 RepID=UPI002E1883BA|nr:MULTISPECIES: ABC transporter substrate-binding protein [unclassified Streptomyces]